MQVQRLDHVNIVTADLDATARFYADILGLERRDGPPHMPADRVQWMHDGAGRAIVHINHVDFPRHYDRAVTPGPTGAIHHVALGCSGYEAMMARLDAKGVAFEVNRPRGAKLRQIFLRDPNDVVLELNFPDN